MIPGNDNHPAPRLIITVESGDGDFRGLYLTCLMKAGVSEPISAEIFGSKEDAYDFARDMMKANPDAVLKDSTGGGGQ